MSAHGSSADEIAAFVVGGTVGVGVVDAIAVVIVPVERG